MPVKKQPEKVYQLHIFLYGSKPKIWRRFLVTEDITLAKLHKIIQEVMGWQDYHLHEFTIDKKSYGLAEESDFGQTIDEKKTKIGLLGLAAKQTFKYTYDFGDGWEHGIKVEKILPFETNIKYPKCLDGEGACPPEDCGGIWGYEELLALKKLPKKDLTEDDRERLKWFSDHNFDYFNIDETNIILWKRFAK